MREKYFEFNWNDGLQFASKKIVYLHWLLMERGECLSTEVGSAFKWYACNESSQNKKI